MKKEYTTPTKSWQDHKEDKAEKDKKTHSVQTKTGKQNWRDGIHFSSWNWFPSAILSHQIPQTSEDHAPWSHERQEKWRALRRFPSLAQSALIWLWEERRACVEATNPDINNLRTNPAISSDCTARQASPSVRKHKKKIQSNDWVGTVALTEKPGNIS